MEGEDEEEETPMGPPEETMQEEAPPANDEQGNALLKKTVDPDEVVRDWESGDPQYEWDEVANEEETPLYRAYEVGTPKSGYLKLKRIAVMCYVTTTACSPNHKHTPPRSPSHESLLAHGTRHEH